MDNLLPQPLFTLEQATVQYPDGRTIGPWNITMHYGEILGLIGTSGSGKSTLVHALAGLLPWHSGNCHWYTQKPGPRRQQLIFQNPFGSLQPKLSIQDAVLEGLHYQRALRIEKGLYTHADMARYARILLEEVGLSASLLTRYPHELSGGQCQRVAIARALAMEPSLLLADECLSALDVIHQEQIALLFQQLRRERGLSIMLVSHDLPLVRTLCDTVLVMHEGIPIEQGSTESIWSHPQQETTRRLLHSAFTWEDYT